MTEAVENQDPAGVNVEDTGAGTATATVDREAVEASREAAAQEELIGGKFKTQEDLLKAYNELQTKLGQGGSEETEETGEAEETTETGDEGEGETEENPYGKQITEALAAVDLDLDEAAKYFDEHGTLTDDDFGKLEKAGYPRAMAEAYLNGIKAMNQQATDAAEAEQGVAQAQIDALTEAVGGKDALAKIRTFVSKSYSPEQKQAYEAELTSGDIGRVTKAVTAAQAAYNKAFGQEGNVLTGKGAAGNDGYASTEEMKADMRKPEYKTSQAFRDQVQRKIAASNIFMTR